ncbi:MAG TPA: sulfur transferase domain-containing protein [Sphingomonas sp.]|jgi:protein-tyrosine phosphatase|nr:sulfur transferase domain-containing protein [Sphingomonas sp.]
MLSDLYWIESASSQRLAIMARPRSGDWLEDEVAHWARAGVETVVSLLEREEVTELGLEREAAICERHGIRFVSFPIADRTVPADASAAMRFAAELAATGQAIAIHCRAGIGRSSIIATAIMVSNGADPAMALTAIGEARGLSVPDTDAQRAWALAL